MIEEFPFTTRVLQAEEDTHSLRRLIAMHTKDVKDKIASLTWARLTWEQRVTASEKIACSIDTKPTSKIAKYHLASKIPSRRDNPIVCETLSQMQF